MKPDKKKFRFDFENFIKKKLIPLLKKENKKISFNRKYISKKNIVDPVTNTI